MERDPEIVFGPFRLDCANQQLWQGEQQLALQPKPLAVLQYLVQHAGRLVTKEELLQQVWAGTRVTPGALTVCIHAIRAILGDTETAPQFIETQGKQGYRFIAPLTTTPQVSSSKFQVPSSEAENGGQQLTTLLIGREQELVRLQECYAAASAGTCQLVFVSGEAGVGKTTLVNRFVASLRTGEQAWIGMGQGVQHHGAGEAYLPVLTVLNQFAREAEQGELRAALQHYAPNWLPRLPALRQEGTSEPSASLWPVVTSQRLMWELGEAFRVLTERRPIVLVFDDLQWSDAATVDWLAYLARWQEPLRLLIIGTYRPADVITSRHPLYAIIQELRGKGRSAELRLEPLNRQQVQDYCTWRFPGNTLPERLITLLYRRTDGNPLFLVRLLEYLVQQGVLLHLGGQWQLSKPIAEFDGAIPQELQGMIEQQVEQLTTEEQRVLDVASVVGHAFASEVVAAGANLLLEQVEAVCDALVRKQQVIEGRGTDEWPDGTITVCYGFQHALFRDVLYRRLGEGRRIRLHRAIADRLEAGYGVRAVEIAGALAVHCTQGRDYYKGAKYYLHAANYALRLSAYREALTHCQQGVELLTHVPASPERDRQELAIRMSLHMALSAVRGQGTQDVEENLKHAQALARKVNDEKALVSAVVALGRVYVARSDRAGALGIAEEDRRLIQWIREPALLIQLHTQLGTIHTFSAEYTQARAHQTQVQTLSTTAEHDPLIFASGIDPLILMCSVSNMGLWLSGWLDQSRRQQDNLLARGEQLRDIFSIIYANTTAAFVAVLRGDLDEARQLLDRSIPLGGQYSSSMFGALGMVVQGCIAVRDGEVETGIDILTKALSDYCATNAQSLLPVFLSFLAEGLSGCGKSEEAFATLAEAFRLAETSLDVYWEAELYRVKGELLLTQEGKNQKAKGKSRKREARGWRLETSPPSFQASSLKPPVSMEAEREAEECFLKAIEIARRQEAKSLELRAVMSLVRLRQQQVALPASLHTDHASRTQLDEAHCMLSNLYHWFTEGFDTHDLQEAKALLTQ